MSTIVSPRASGLPDLNYLLNKLVDSLSVLNVVEKPAKIEKTNSLQEFRLSKAPPRKPTTKKDVREINKKQVTELIQDLKQWATIEKEEHIHWSKFFFTMARMREKSFNYEDCERIRGAATNFLENTKKNEITEAVTGLVEYLDTHIIDTGNTLIGLRPNESYFSEYYGISADGRKNLIKSDTDEILFIKLVDSINKKNKAPGENYLFRAGELAFYFEHGAFVPTSATYVRIVENVKPTQKFVKIITDPHETIHRTTKIEYLLEIHDTISRNILTNGPSKLHIQDPVDQWFADIRIRLMDRF